jgi:hypothetical protein
MSPVIETVESRLAYRSWDEGTRNDLARRYQSALPFPHLVIDGFLTADPDRLLAAFPGTEWDGWSRFHDQYQRRKMFCGDIDRIPPTLAAIIHDLCSPAFLGFLETVTDIRALVPDPYLDGGGLHCSGSGGILAPHTDFHLYRRLNLYRRVNVIVYLNPEWQEEYGGCLEFYRKGSVVPSVVAVPRWGTGVIFTTDDRSVHGFSKPIVGDRWRRSIALYYYTSRESEHFSGDEDTHWQTHGQLSGFARMRLKIYQALLFASRCFSRAAHRANPNFRSSPTANNDHDQHD